MNNMELYTFEEVQDELLGKQGTPRRDKFEKDVDDAIQAYKIGEAIKQARKANRLTQEQLGRRIGVQKAQISRLERGKGITFNTMSKVFRAMDVSATLDMGKIGRIPLW